MNRDKISIIVLFLLVFLGGIGIGWISKWPSAQHQSIYINDAELHVPQSCDIIFLDPERPGFASLLCSKDQEGKIGIIFTNIINDKNKQKDIMDAIKNEKKIDKYTCGNIKFDVYSCYDEYNKIIISSKDKSIILYFLDSQ
jgi:hypothetical protein